MDFLEKFVEAVLLEDVGDGERLQIGEETAGGAAGFGARAGAGFAEDAAEETLKTVVSWARFGELFSYDDDAASFSLENPT